MLKPKTKFKEELYYKHIYITQIIRVDKVLGIYHKETRCIERKKYLKKTLKEIKNILTSKLLETLSMNIKFNPLDDRVVILATKVEEKTASGIILSTTKERPLKGEVIKVGPGSEDYTMKVKPGDIVSFGKYSGSEYEEGGITYLILRAENDIFGIHE